MMQGEMLPNPGLTSKFLLVINGMPDLKIPSMGALEQELAVFTAPDRTQHSGAQVSPGETEVTAFSHHGVEHAAWQAWWRQSKVGGVGYKRTAQLHILNGSGAIVRTIAIVGAFPRKVGTPDLDAGEDGSEVRFTWTLAYDGIEV